MGQEVSQLEEDQAAAVAKVKGLAEHLRGMRDDVLKAHEVAVHEGILASRELAQVWGAPTLLLPRLMCPPTRPLIWSC